MTTAASQASVLLPDDEVKTTCESASFMLSRESESPELLLNICKLLDSVAEEDDRFSEDQLRWLMKEGLMKVCKAALTASKRNYLPYALRIVTRMIDIALIGLPYDNSHLLAMLLEIFDDTKGIHWSTKNYPYDPQAMGNLTPADEKWATISQYPQGTYYRETQSLVMLRFINHFGSRGGFEALVGRLMRTDPKPSIPVVRDLLKIISKIRSSLNASVRNVIFSDVQRIVFELLLGLTDDELRPVRKEDIEDIVSQLEHMMHSCVITDRDAEREHDLFCLDFALKCFRCPLLDKRLHGLNYMEVQAESVQFRHRSPTVMVYDSRPQKRHLDLPFLLDWLRENKIFEQVFEHQHQALISRVHKLIRFMARNHRLGTEHLNLIWESTADKHEAIRYAAYEALGTAATDLTFDHTRFLFERISKVSPRDCSPQLINLLYELGRHATREESTRFVDHLWTICADGADARTETSKAAVDTIVKLMTSGSRLSSRLAVLRTHVQNVTQGTSVLQSLQVIRGLLDSYRDTDREEREEKRQILISMLHVDIDIIPKLIASLSAYKQRAVAQLPSPPPPDADVMAMTFGGTATYADQIKARLDFIAYLLSQTDGISDQLMDMFWQELVLNATTALERSEGLEWLLKLAAERDNRGVPHLFQELMCKRLPLNLVTPAIFEIFIKALTKQNLHEKRMLRTTGEDYEVDNYLVCGLDQLWRLALESADVKVSKAAVEFLIKLQHKLSPKMRKDINVVRKQFIEQCLAYLAAYGRAKGDSAAMSVERCITVLKTFIESVPRPQPKPVAPPPEAAPPPSPAKPTKLPVPKPKDAEQKAMIGEWLSITDNKKELLAILALQRNQWQLQNAIMYWFESQAELLVESEKYDDEPEPPKPEVAAVAAEELHPEQILAQTPAAFDTLFELLKLPQIDRQLVWDVVAKLPTNKRMLDEFSNLDELAAPVEDPSLREAVLESFWGSLLDRNSVFRMLYALRIIDSLIPAPEDTPEKSAEKRQWCRKFYHTGGFHYLFDMLVRDEQHLAPPKNDATEKAATDAWKNSMALLLKIIHYFMKGTDKLSGLASRAPASSGGRSALLLSQGTSELLIRSVDFHKFITVLVHLLWRFARPKRASSGTSSAAVASASDESFDSEVVGHTIHLLITSILADSEHLLGTFLKCKVLRDDGVAGELGIEQFVLELLHSPSAKVRSVVGAGFYDLYSSLKAEPQVRALFKDQLLARFPAKQQDPALVSSYDAYFDFLVKLIRADCSLASGAAAATMPPEYVKLLNAAVTEVKTRPVLELRTTDPADHVLAGCMQVIATLAALYPALKLDLGRSAGHGLVFEVLNNCLFTTDVVDTAGPHTSATLKTKCKSSASRSAALKLVAELARGCEPNFLEVLGYLAPRHVVEAVPKFAFLSGADAGNASEKSQAGFVGLRNLGATCYMNSMMQQWFMVPQLRRAMLSVPIEQVETESEDKQLLVHLQEMFGHLQESEKSYYDPEPFCKAFKMNVFQQQDVEEFFNLLCDRLEELLQKKNRNKNLPHAKVLDDVFAGTTTQQLVCKQQHMSEREDIFHAVNLEIKNKKDLHAALEAFCAGEQIEDFRCDGCNAKVNITKRTLLKRLPNVLTISLKRFEFDIEKATRQKLQQRFEFPLSVNVRPYTKTDASDASRPDADYLYKLVGVIVHHGSAESGHYYSLIKDRSRPDGEHWYRFDDTSVTPFALKDLEEAAFGGKHQVTNYDYWHRPSVSWRDKPNNVYMLFYERANRVWDTTAAAATANAIAAPMPSLSSSASSTPLPKNVLQRIWQDNAQLLREKQLYDPEYFSFVYDLASANMGLLPPCDSYSGAETGPTFQSVQLYTHFVFDTLIRRTSKPQYDAWIALLRQLYSMHLPGARWFLHTLINSRAVGWWKLLIFEMKEPHAYLREGLAELVMHCVRLLAPLERHAYVYSNPEEFLAEELRMDLRPAAPYPTAQTTAVARYIDFHLSQLDVSRLHWRQFSTYFGMLKDVSALGQPERRYLLQRNAIFWLLDYYMGEFSKYREGPHLRPKIGDKSQPADLVDFWLLVVNLLRSVRTDGVAHAGRASPYGWKDDDYTQLTPWDKCSRKIFWQKELMGSVIRQAYNLKANYDLIRAASWEDQEHSQWFIELISEALLKSSAESTAVYENWLSATEAILSIEDSVTPWRLECFFGTSAEPPAGVVPAASLLRHLRDKGRLSPVVGIPAVKLTEFLVHMISTFPHVHQHLYQSRESWMWIIDLLREKSEPPPPPQMFGTHMYTQPQAPSPQQLASAMICAQSLKQFFAGEKISVQPHEADAMLQSAKDRLAQSQPPPAAVAGAGNNNGGSSLIVHPAASASASASAAGPPSSPASQTPPSTSAQADGVD